MSNCSSLLLGLTDIEVDLVGVAADGARDVRVLTAAAWVRRCPQCAVVSTRSKGWVLTRPKDVKVGPDIPNLLWCKQKWLCRNTSGVRKQFTESVPQIPPRARFTVRAKAEMAAAVLDGWRSVAEVSAAFGTTWNTCHRAVVAVADPILSAELLPVTVLGIDETRRGKAKWETDPVTGERTWVDRFDTGLVDISGDQGLLAQVNAATSPRSSTGSRLRAKSSGPGSRTWRLTCPPAMPKRSGGRCRTPGSSSTTSTW